MALPPGLTLNSTTGVLSGTPTSAGSYTFAVITTDAVGATGSQTYNAIINTPVAIITSALPASGVNVSGYSQAIVATGGTGPLSFSITAGALPTGLNLISGSGVIYGKPTATGTFNFTVTATDSVGTTARKNYTILITPITAYLPTINVSLSSGNLLVADVTAPPADNITLSADTTHHQYTVFDPANVLATSISGAIVSADQHTVTVPFSSVTGTNIDVNTLGISDVLTVNFALGSFASSPAPNITFTGQSGRREHARPQWRRHLQQRGLQLHQRPRRQRPALRRPRHHHGQLYQPDPPEQHRYHQQRNAQSAHRRSGRGLADGQRQYGNAQLRQQGLRNHYLCRPRLLRFQPHLWRHPVHRLLRHGRHAHRCVAQQQFYVQCRQLGHQSPRSRQRDQLPEHPDARLQHRQPNHRQAASLPWPRRSTGATLNASPITGGPNTRVYLSSNNGQIQTAFALAANDGTVVVPASLPTYTISGSYVVPSVQATLEVDGTLANSGTLTVNSPSTLDGSGTINGSVSGDGNFEPGDASGPTLTINGNFLPSSGSDFTYQLGDELVVNTATAIPNLSYMTLIISPHSGTPGGPYTIISDPKIASGDYFSNYMPPVTTVAFDDKSMTITSNPEYRDPRRGKCGDGRPHSHGDRVASAKPFDWQHAVDNGYFSKHWHGRRLWALILIFSSRKPALTAEPRTRARFHQALRQQEAHSFTTITASPSSALSLSIT